MSRQALVHVRFAPFVPFPENSPELILRLRSASDLLHDLGFEDELVYKPDTGVRLAHLSVKALSMTSRKSGRIQPVISVIHALSRDGGSEREKGQSGGPNRRQRRLFFIGLERAGQSSIDGEGSLNRLHLARATVEATARQLFYSAPPPRLHRLAHAFPSDQIHRGP